MKPNFPNLKDVNPPGSETIPMEDVVARQLLGG